MVSINLSSLRSQLLLQEVVCFFRDCFSRISFAIISLFFLTLLLTTLQSECNAQKTDVFATVRLNRKSVFPKEPIKVTISVSTTTWFTKPLDFDNIQVANSFVIPFKRTLSMMRKVNNKNYASLEFYYLVYPYQSGTYQVPSIKIIAETPPEGGYKGREVTMTTQPVTFKVKEIPDHFTSDEWFVAKGLTLAQSWDRPLSEIKVGDVVERTITIKASGTLPNFIPALNFDDVPFGSIYVKSANLRDLRNEKNANGMRTEKVLYLFERVGTFEMPGIRVVWWNPYVQRSFFKEIAPQTITIQDNAQLGIIKTLKDSLALSSDQVQLVTAEAGQKILGLKPWQFFTGLLLILLILRYLIRQLRKTCKGMMEARAHYLVSERYFFRQALRSNATAKDKWNHLHRWWDVIWKSYGYSPSLKEAITVHDHPVLADEFTQIESKIFGDNNQYKVNINRRRIRAFRDSILSRDKNEQQISYRQVNRVQKD